MMKKQWIKVVCLSGLIFAGLLTACSSDATLDELPNEEAINLKSAEVEAEINEATDASSDIIEEVYLSQEFPETKSSEADRYLPSCVTITTVLTNTTKTVTIDFGEGCTLRNGNFLSGKIILSYEKDREAATKKISFEYVEFQFNRKSIEGSGSILRERSNVNGNPQSTKTFDVTVTWPDGTFASREGQRVREMIEGQGTSAWGDNVFSITGYWKFTRKNGVEISVTILDALRRELACKFIVSGVVELQRGTSSGILDYGDGACDDLATWSVNGGEPREIHLGN